MYDKINQVLRKFFKPATLFRVMFNISPMYKRSTAKILAVSDNLYTVNIIIPLSYKNRNYVGTIFGGSLFSATDPIFMVQLIQILGKDFVVWDKLSTIQFKRPANSDAYATFSFTEEEIKRIKDDAASEGSINLVKSLDITNKNGDIVFAQVEKTIYIATKEYYAQRKKPTPA